MGFTSLREALDFTTPGGRLAFHVFATLAKFIHELIVQDTNEGLDVARACGTRLGRPPAMTEEQVLHARDLLTLPGTPSRPSRGSWASAGTRSTSTCPNCPGLRS
ncbi:recombinase family protein [Streptomyces malaysiensis]|uniref:recombinase family protein n=1 Tax=Streptomyces malaysiensis TaxID=92644 RepID=UPI0020304BCB|nr:recombinase family protein [Streptomyces malaysiensis]